MSRKIIGVTVGTPMRPQALIEKTEQASQIAKNTEDISDLREKIPEVYVKTVNGKKGDVTLDSDDVGTYSYSQIDVIKKDIYEHIQSEAYHLETYADNGDAALSKALDESVQYLLEKIDEIPTSCGGTGGAVSSVNGKTGAVELTAEDVGARPSTWTPTAEDVGARSDTWMPTAEEVGATTKSYVDGEIGERFITVTSVNEIIGSVSNQKTITCFLDNDCLEELGLSDTEAMYGFGLAVRKSPGFILLQFAINGTRFVYGELSTGTKTFEFEEGYSKAELDAKFTALNNKYQPKGNYLTDAPVKSVNGKTGDVTLSASDVGAATSEEVSSLKSDFNEHTGNTTSHVTSDEKTTWNNKSNFSGKYSDLSGKPTIPSKTSQLTNDSGFVTNVPVKSVNGMTGDVVIDTITEEDKARIVADVLDAIVVQYPDAHVIYGDVDENNVITLYGTLADDTYTIKYEKEDGTTIDIGTLVTEEVVEIINQIPLSQNADGSLFVGTNNEKGYKTGFRLSASSGTESEASGVEVTGFIPVKLNDDVYFQNVIDDGSHVICIYDSSHAKIASATVKNAFPSVDTLDGSVQTFKVIGGNFASTADVMTNAKFMRVSASEITDNSIITVNQPIE